MADELKSFQLVIKPGQQSLKSRDYWIIFIFCSVAAFALLIYIGSTI